MTAHTKIVTTLPAGAPMMKPVTVGRGVTHLYPDLNGAMVVEGEEALCGRAAKNPLNDKHYLYSAVYHEDATASLIHRATRFGETHKTGVCLKCAATYVERYGEPTETTVTVN